MSDENWAAVREAVRDRTAEVRISEDHFRHALIEVLRLLEAELTRLAETVKVCLVFAENGRTGDSET